jgi:cell division protease FtsH
MKQDNGSGRKPTDGKSGGQNVVFYLIALAVATTFLVTWFVRNSGHVISYQHLLQLVEANQPDAAGDGSIEVDEQLRDGKERTVRLSNPKNIVVGDRSVRGEVDIEYLSPPFPKKRSLTAAKFVAYKSGSETIEAALIDRLQSSTLDWSSEPEPSRWQAYAPMLIFTGILILFFVIMMRRLGGAGSPMQFGRSRGKLYALEDLGVTFDDAAGIDEAVEEVREIVDFLRSPDKYQRLGGGFQRAYCWSDLPEPARPCLPRPLLEKPMCRSSAFPGAILSRCSWVLVPPEFEICSSKQNRTHRVLSSSMNLTPWVKLEGPVSSEGMMNANRR